MATGTIKNDLVTTKTQITPLVTLTHGGIYAMKNGKNVTIYIFLRTQNNVTGGTVLANIPSGLRPYGTIDMTTDQNGAQVQLRFGENGDIMTKSALNTTWLYTACSYVIE